MSEQKDDDNKGFVEEVNDDGETVIRPEDQETEPEAEEANQEEEVQGEQEEEQEESKGDEEEDEGEGEATEEESEDSDLVSIDGQEYTREELEQIFETGKRVKEYQKDHEGFDPILMHRDYTKKSMRLSKVEKLAREKGLQIDDDQDPLAPTSAAPVQKEAKPEVDLSKFKKEDVEYFKSLASALGYVNKDELEKRTLMEKQQSYTSRKNKVVSDFVSEHPEYSPSNDPGDKNWNALLSEFKLYKLPTNPEKIRDLLERSHGAVSGETSKIKKAAEILAQKKINKSAASSSGGSSSGNTKKAGKGKIPEHARKGLKGYSEEELEELFS